MRKLEQIESDINKINRLIGMLDDQLFEEFLNPTTSKTFRDELVRKLNVLTEEQQLHLKK